MAKIKLRLSSKSEESDIGLQSAIKDDAVPTTLKIKPLKKPTQSQVSSTSGLPKITLKTSSNSGELPKIKIKGPESNETVGKDYSGVKMELKTPKIRVKPVKLPGNGYDSEDPDKEDDPLVEEAIVIRFLPDESLDTVRAAVENSERTGDKNGDRAGIDLSCISVTWVDKRRAIVRINNLLYAAKLVNLPTISEVHKTIDKKNIFKTVDVCQMLLVVKQISDESEISNLKVDKEYGETYPDGLTPPLESIKDKFEKKYESEVIQNVEDEVARLLKLDAEAESSAFEFIDADKENVTPMSVLETKLRKKLSKKEKKRRRKENERLRDEGQTSADSNHLIQKEEGNNIDDEFGDLDDELDRLMGEEGNEDHTIAGEDDEEDEEEEDDDEEEEEEEEEEVDEEVDVEMADANTTAYPQDEEEEDEEEDDDDDDDEEEDAIDDNLRDNISGDESAQHNALIMEEVVELESTIAQKEKDLKKAINPIMRNRIMDVISRLKQELEMKRQLIVEESHSGNENEEDEQEVIAANNEDAMNGDLNVDGDVEEDVEEEAQQITEKNGTRDDEKGNDGEEEEEEEEEDDDEYGDLF